VGDFATFLKSAVTTHLCFCGIFATLPCGKVGDFATFLKYDTTNTALVSYLIWCRICQVLFGLFLTG